jgi:FkbM family methyltransferase
MTPSRVGPLLVTAAAAGALVWTLSARYYTSQIAAVNDLSAEGAAVVRELQNRYGTHVSRGVEEWVVRDFFNDRREGIFLDVGANHYRDENNTYYLETALGWSGLAVEAQPQYGPDYQRHRSRTRFVAMFAADIDGATVPFFVPTDQAGKLVASATKALPESVGLTTVQTDVPTATLNTVLTQAGITRLDFMSMDIELAEPKALAGFDIDRYRPALVCIEAHGEVRQAILDYFQSHGYVTVSKYLRADVMNLYFRPAGSADSVK